MENESEELKIEFKKSEYEYASVHCPYCNKEVISYFGENLELGIHPCKHFAFIGTFDGFEAWSVEFKEKYLSVYNKTFLVEDFAVPESLEKIGYVDSFCVIDGSLPMGHSGEFTVYIGFDKNQKEYLDGGM